MGQMPEVIAALQQAVSEAREERLLPNRDETG